MTATGVGISTAIDAVQARIQAACARVGRDPREVTLIAVSKTVDAARVSEAFDAGLRDFGENRAQEALPKLMAVEASGRRPRWHFIGHLQSNKAKAVVERFDTIHSIDSMRLLERVDNVAVAPIDVFLEVNVSGETTKDGIAPPEVAEFVAAAQGLNMVRLVGMMTVAPRVATPEEARPVFRELRTLAHTHGLSGLSMGMTEDFEVAIEEGATHVRIGRALFGERV